MCYSRDPWPESHLWSQVWTVLGTGPGDLTSCPSPTHFCDVVTSFIFFQCCHADKTQNRAPPAFHFPLVPWAPFLTGCLATFLSSTFTRLQSSTSSCIPLVLPSCIVSFMNVWVLHNAVCTVGKQIRSVYLNDSYTRKNCQNRVCFGSVHTCADVTVVRLYKYVSVWEDWSVLWMVLVTFLSALSFINNF